MGSWCWMVYQRHKAGMREPSTAFGVALEAPIPSAGPRCAALVSPLVTFILWTRNYTQELRVCSCLVLSLQLGESRGAVNLTV